MRFMIKERVERGCGAAARWLHAGWTFSRVTFLVIVGLIVLLVAARLALPYVLRSAINRRLEHIPGYTGHVESIRVDLWRGAYVLEHLATYKRRRGGPGGVPFFSARRIDFSLAWRDLIHGRVVSDIVVDRARLTFIRTKSPEQSQLATDRRWQDAIKDIFPIDITRLEVNDSHLHYLDQTAAPVVDVFMEHMYGVATGLRNRPAQSGTTFPASFRLTGETIGKGRLTFAAQAEPLAQQPHFELSVKVQGVALPALNRFLRAYGKVDVSAGTFQLYLEMAARDGRYDGYAKPFFTHVKFADVAGQGKTAVDKLWEMLVSGVVELVKNKPRDQLGTRIPFAGQFGQARVGFWATIANLIRNGFVRALPAALEHSIRSGAIPPPPKPVPLPSRAQNPSGQGK